VLSAVWLAAVVIGLAFEGLAARRRLTQIRKMLIAYESSVRVFDPVPLNAATMAADIRRLMRRHALGDALFPGQSFSEIEGDLRLSDGANEGGTAVRAKMRLLLYRIYGYEEYAARRILHFDEIARRFCEGPVYTVRVLSGRERLRGERLLVGLSWVAALYALMLRYTIWL